MCSLELLDVTFGPGPGTRKRKSEDSERKLSDEEMGVVSVLVDDLFL